MIGTTVDQFKIVKALSKNFVFETFLAVHAQTGARYIMEAVTPRIASQNGFRDKFLADSVKVIQLDHPNILPLTNVLEDGGRLFTVREHIEGKTLAKVIKSGEMNLEQMVDLFTEALSGLGFAHDQGFVHRFMNPDNILVTAEGARIINFGQVLQRQKERIKDKDKLAGLAKYFSPERFANPSTTDVRANLYAMGVILYQMATGRLPFDSSSYAELKQMHESSPWPDPLEINPSLPAAVVSMIETSLAKEPEGRYQSAVEFQRAAQSMGMDEGASGGAAVTPSFAFDFTGNKDLAAAKPPSPQEDGFDPTILGEGFEESWTEDQEPVNVEETPTAEFTIPRPDPNAASDDFSFGGVDESFGSEPEPAENDAFSFGGADESFGSGGNDSAFGGDDPAPAAEVGFGFGDDPAPAAEEAFGFGDDPAPAAEEAFGFGDDPAPAAEEAFGFGDDPVPAAEEAFGFGDDPAPAAEEAFGFGDDPAPAAEEAFGFGDDPAPAAEEAFGFGDDPAPAAEEAFGFGDDPAPAAEEGFGFGDEPEPAADESFGFGDDTPPASDDNFSFGGEEPASPVAEEASAFGGDDGLSGDSAFGFGGDEPAFGDDEPAGHSDGGFAFGDDEPASGGGDDFAFGGDSPDSPDNLSFGGDEAASGGGDDFSFGGDEAASGGGDDFSFGGDEPADEAVAAPAADSGSALEAAFDTMDDSQRKLSPLESAFEDINPNDGQASALEAAFAEGDEGGHSALDQAFGEVTSDHQKAHAEEAFGFGSGSAADPSFGFDFKDGQDAEPAGDDFSFDNEKPAADQFSFGEESQEPEAPAAAGGFDFGSETPVNEAEPATDDFDFGAGSTPDASGGGFDFGSESAPADSSGGGGGFDFGSESAPADSGGGFDFGSESAPAESDSGGGFDFGSESAPADSGGGFDFGADSGGDSAGDEFSFGEEPAAAADEFSFGEESAPAVGDAGDAGGDFNFGNNDFGDASANSGSFEFGADSESDAFSFEDDTSKGLDAPVGSDPDILSNEEPFADFSTEGGFGGSPDDFGSDDDGFGEMGFGDAKASFGDDEDNSFGDDPLGSTEDGAFSFEALEEPEGFDPDSEAKRGLDDSLAKLEDDSKKKGKPEKVKRRVVRTVDKKVLALTIVLALLVGAGIFSFVIFKSKKADEDAVIDRIQLMVETRRYDDALGEIDGLISDGAGSGFRERLLRMRTKAEKEMDETSGQIATLIERAIQYESDGASLTDGKTDALGAYMKVLSLNPANEEAKQGVFKIKEAQYERAQQARAQGKELEALQILGALAKADRTDKQLVAEYNELKGKLKEEQSGALKAKIEDLYGKQTYLPIVTYLGELDQIEPNTKYVKEMRKNLLEALEARAQEHYSKEEYDQSEKYYRAALELDEGNTKFTNILSQLEEDRLRSKIDDILSDLEDSVTRKNYPRQFRLANQLLELDPGNQVANSALNKVSEEILGMEKRAENARELGQFKEAAGIYKQVYEINGNKNILQLWQKYQRWTPPPGMAFLPVSKVTIGRNKIRNARPAHEVTISNFFIDQYEVTNREFLEFVRAEPDWAPGKIDDSLHDGNYLSHWVNGKPIPADMDLPVTQVSWFAAAAFAEFKGKRLPTEAEWEKAAAGNTKAQKFWWGNYSDAKMAVYEFYPEKRPAPVGKFPANGYGIHEIIGNVNEWVQDAYSTSFYEQSQDAKDPVNDDSGDKVYRGGSFRSRGKELALYLRNSADPRTCDPTIGFRCALNSQLE